MTTPNTEYRTKFEMETDTGELFDALEYKAQQAFNDIFTKDADPFESESRITTMRWSRAFD